MKALISLHHITKSLFKLSWERKRQTCETLPPTRRPKKRME